MLAPTAFLAACGIENPFILASRLEAFANDSLESLSFYIEYRDYRVSYVSLLKLSYACWLRLMDVGEPVLLAINTWVLLWPNPSI